MIRFPIERRREAIARSSRPESSGLLLPAIAGALLAGILAGILVGLVRNPDQ